MADQAVPEGGPKPAPVVIKKYANRRLYNTATSAYVTLEHLSQMVKDKTDFVVYDAKTGDDLTRTVLLPSQVALAALLSTSRESVARTLARLELDGHVRRIDRWYAELGTDLRAVFEKPVKAP